MGWQVYDPGAAGSETPSGWRKFDSDGSLIGAVSATETTQEDDLTELLWRIGRIETALKFLDIDVEAFEPDI